jgi:drug/metabolite transporter (DMT)-like permease
VSRKGWLLFASMSVIWGIPYLLIKVAVGGVSVPVLVFARTFVGALVLLPLAIHRRELAVLKAHWRPLLVFAVIEIIGPWWLLSSAEEKLSSSMSGLMIAAVPIIGALLGWLISHGSARKLASHGAAGSARKLASHSSAGSARKLASHGDRLTPTRWAGLIVGLGGVGLLVGPGAHGASPLAIVEVLLTALGYSIGPLIADRHLTGIPRLGMTAACLAFSALVYTPAAAVDLPHAMPSAKVIGSMLGLALVCTALAFLLFFALIAEIGPARATVITYVNPAVAVALGVGLLGEPFTVEIAVSFCLILAGSVFATRSGGPKRPAPQAIPALSD